MPSEAYIPLLKGNMRGHGPVPHPWMIEPLIYTGSSFYNSEIQFGYWRSYLFSPKEDEIVLFDFFMLHIIGNSLFEVLFLSQLGWHISSSCKDLTSPSYFGTMTAFILATEVNHQFVPKQQKTNNTLSFQLRNILQALVTSTFKLTWKPVIFFSLGKRCL